MSKIRVNEISSFSGTGVGIGTSSSDASAILELNSTTQGMLGIRMTQTQRDAMVSPAVGLEIYNLTTMTKEAWNGTIWAPVDGVIVKKNVIEVQKDPRAQFQSIAAAVNSITDASITNIYLIKVSPGEYNEPEIVMKPYVIVYGEAQETVSVYPDGNHNIFTMCNNSVVSFLTMGYSPVGYAAVKMEDVGIFALMHKVSMYSCDTAIRCTTTALGMESEIYLEYVDYTGDNTTAIALDVSSNTYPLKITAENFWVYGDGTNPAYSIKVDGANTYFSFMSGGLLGESVTGKGLYVSGGASCDVSGAIIRKFDKAIECAVDGLSTTLRLSDIIFYDNTVNLQLMDATVSGFLIGYSEFSKNQIHASSSFYMVNQEKNLIKVAKSGGNFSTIVAAMNYITDNSPTNPYIISVFPGIYTEEKITIKSHVTLKGEAVDSVIILPDGNHDVISMGEYSYLNNVTITNAPTGYSGIDILDCGEVAGIDKVTIYGCSTGIKVRGVTTPKENILSIVNSYIISDGIGKSIDVSAVSGSTYFITCSNVWTKSETTDPTEYITIDGPNVQTSFSGGGIIGIASTGTGISVSNGAFLIINGYVIYRCSKGILGVVDASSTKFELSSVSFDSCTVELDIQDSTSTGYFFGTTEYLKTLVNVSSSFYIANKQPTIVNVAKKGADFTSIKAAMASILDASSSNRYIIKVSTGVFTEDTIQMKPYVYIRGESGASTIISTDATSKHLFLGAPNSAIQDATLTGCTDSGKYAVYFDNNIAAGGLEILNCRTGNVYGIVYTRSNGYDTTLTLNTFQSTGAMTKGLDIGDDGTHYCKVFLANTVIFNNISYFVEITGVSSTLTTGNVNVANYLAAGATAIKMSNGANVSLSAVKISGFTNGIWVENVGTGTVLDSAALIVLNSSSKDLLVEQPTAIGSINGELDRDKITIDASATYAMLINHPDGSGATVVGELYQGTDFNKTTNMSAKNLECGGRLTGGNLTFATDQLTVAAGTGYVFVGGGVDSYYSKYISWIEQTITLATDGIYYVYIDENGLFSSALAEPNIYTHIRLGRAVVIDNEVHTLNVTPRDASYINIKIENFLRQALGPVVESGMIVAANALDKKKLDMSNGSYFYGTAHFNPTGATPITMEGHYRDGLGGWEEVDSLIFLTVAEAATGTHGGVLFTADNAGIVGNSISLVFNGTDTVLQVKTAWNAANPANTVSSDPAHDSDVLGATTLNLTGGLEAEDNWKYDNNLGYLSVITGGKYVKHSLYVVNDSTNQKNLFVYGQTEYNDLVSAQGADLPTPPDYISYSCCLVATIIVKQGEIDIAEVRDERPVIGFKATGVSASATHANLLGLLEDDHPQYLLISGSRAMTGPLDMGTQNITNVGTVDGVDVSAHASRHLPTGADALTTAAPTTSLSSTTTNAVGIQNSLARSDHSHAILTGAVSTQTPDQANAAGSSANLAKADHIHSIPTAVASGLDSNSTSTQGAAASFARSNHTHAIASGLPSAQTPDQANAAGSSANFAKADHIHNIPAAAPSSIGASNSKGSNASFALSDHIHQGIHSLKANSTGTARYNDLVLQQGNGISIIDDGVGNFTIDTTNGPNEFKVTYSGSGLSVDYTGGLILLGGAFYTIAAGSLVLPASSSGCIYVNNSGTVTYSASLLDGVTPIAYFTTNLTLVTSLIDRRSFLRPNNTWGIVSDVSTISATLTTSAGILNKSVRADHIHGINTGAPSSQTPNQINTTGSSANLARADHIHNIPTAAPLANLTSATTNADGSAASFSRSDHSHSITTDVPVSVGTSNAQGSGPALARADHIHDHGSQSTGTHHAAVTTSVNGFMSTSDKIKLDGITYYRTTGTQTSTSTTYEDIAELTTSSLEVGSYIFEFVGIFQSTATGTGTGFRIGDSTGTIGMTSVLWQIQQGGNGTDKMYQYTQMTSTDNVNSASISAANTDSCVVGIGCFTITGTGTVAIQLRSETGNAVSVRAGSMLKITKIA